MTVSLHPTTGFTLLETILYIGLFTALFTGIFTSIYPLFGSAEKLTLYTLRESEANFVLAKIDAALMRTLTTPVGHIISPRENSHSNELILGTSSVPEFHFAVSSSSSFCSPPRICSFMTLTTQAFSELPLNNERILLDDFHATHTPPNPNNRSERILEFSFTVDGHLVGPVRYYFRF